MSSAKPGTGDEAVAPQDASPRIRPSGRPRRRPRAIWRRLVHHPRYTLWVLATLLTHPRLVLDALRFGWRQALLRTCTRLLPAAAGLFTPYEAGFFGQVFLFDEYEVGRLRLPAEPVVLDVGANVGFFSWRVLARYPGARLVALEPATANWTRLVRLLQLLGASARPIRAACSSAPGTATLFLRSSVTHSLNPHWHPELDRRAGTEEVPVVTIDGVCDAVGIAAVDLLKIDVEGAEADVLQGARSILRRTRHVVLEYHSRALRDACRALLDAAGFRCREKRFWGADASTEEGILLCDRTGYPPRDILQPFQEIHTS